MKEIIDCSATGRSAQVTDLALFRSPRSLLRRWLAGSAACSALAATLTLPALHAATSIVATHDAWVQGGSANQNTNHGTDTVLKVKYSTSGAAFQYESYLIFPISGISGTISDARVRLFGAPSSGDGAGVAVSCYSVANVSWNETTITWANKPAPSASALTSTSMIDLTNRWYEWNITSYVQAQKTAGATVIAVMFKNSTSTNSIMNFNSSENASNKAELSVTTGSSQVAAPTYNPPAGSYGSAQSVTISTATSGATIRYTTNGTTPSSTVGTVYSTPVSISTTTTLKAIAYKTGMTDSTVTSGTYTITTNSVPVITTTSLPDASAGVAYNQTLAATGGNGTLVWSIASGALPAGLSLSSGGAISGTPTVSAVATANFTVKVADSDGVTGPTDEDTQALTIATKAGPAGVRYHTGTFFQLGAAASNFSAFKTAMNRTTGNGDPIRYLSLSLSKKQLNSSGTDLGFLGVAKNNATDMVNQFSGVTDATLCIILPLWTVPGDSASLTNRTNRANAILAGTHDADFINIFAKFNNAGMASRVIFRLGHEAEIVGSYWYKLDMNENLWRNAWDYVAQLGKGVNANFRFDYQGNGPFFTAVSASDTRKKWQFAMPTQADIFGCDLYIGHGKTPLQVLADVDELQSTAQSLGKVFSIPEMGAWHDVQGLANLVDDDPSQPTKSVRLFLQDLIDLLKTYPVSGAGSCLYWNWFEGDIDTGLKGTSGGGGTAPWPNPTPNWPNSWTEYKNQLGN